MTAQVPRFPCSRLKGVRSSGPFLTQLILVCKDILRHVWGTSAGRGIVKDSGVKRTTEQKPEESPDYRKHSFTNVGNAASARDRIPVSTDEGVSIQPSEPAASAHPKRGASPSSKPQK